MITKQTCDCYALVDDSLRLALFLRSLYLLIVTSILVDFEKLGTCRLAS